METNLPKTGPSEEKTLLRERLRQARGGLSPERRREYDQAIHARLKPCFRPAETIFCYVSTDIEVNTRVIIDGLSKQGKTVLVPRLVNRDYMIAVRFDGWETLQVGQLGILTPGNDEEWHAPVDLCITPGLGFTPDGKRLGYGKGYYDKWFATHPHTLRTALCYECQVVDDIPTTATDVAVHQVITEKRNISCSNFVIPAQAGT